MNDMPQDKVITTVKAEGHISVFYRGEHIGTVIDGDPVSLAEVTEAAVDRYVVRMRGKFKTVVREGLITAVVQTAMQRSRPRKFGWWPF